MQPFILWQKEEPPYIFGILSNFKKVQIGYFDSYGNKVYYASYYDYEDISDDYEPEQQPNSSENFTGADWNRYQQRKHYKNLRENLNNSSNPEYTRPQQPNDIQFSPLQHNKKVLKGASDLMKQAQARQQSLDKEVLENKVYRQIKHQNQALLLAKLIGSAGYGMMNNDLEAMNMQRLGYWVYWQGYVMYVDEHSIINKSFPMENSKILEVGMSYTSVNNTNIVLNEGGIYSENGIIKNARYISPPKPHILSNIGMDEYAEMNKVIKENPKIKEALDEIIKSEAGYVDNLADPGGKTMYGIAEEKEWKNFAKRFNIDPNPKNIKQIKQKQAELYYFETRYYRFRLDEIEDRKLIIAIFDQSVLIPELINPKIKRALKNQGYNVQINNKNLTNQEVQMINSADQNKLLNDFLDYCLEHYESIKTTNRNNYNKHINGWRNRLSKLR